jgi:hypothetical protein
MYAFTSPNWPTLHNIFSNRLRRSFDAVAHPFPDGTGDPDLKSGTWADLKTTSRPENGASVPELILCCAQQRNGIASGGQRAETFTISPTFVRQGRRAVDTATYLEAAGSVKRLWWNEFRDIADVSSWLATTGAAFSSAMGRMSLGTTNAFLAAVNADLGIWLPNVRVLQEADKAHPHRQQTGPTDTVLFPRPRFGYLFKEILGWYSSRDDRFVFITDGGHWDNLGLVELLRRDCDIIYCIDASADQPGTFTTLRQALALASLELTEFSQCRVDVDKYVRDMLPTAHYLPQAIAATLSVPRTGRAPVTVHYTKLQAIEDMGHRLRRYALADPKFPMYSTLRQFLSPLQFRNLVELGVVAGNALVGSASETP